jgi:LPS-assembly protein
VPELWLPIVSFPTTDERRTGVLAPTLGRDDKNGLDFKLPVYLQPRAELRRDADAALAVEARPALGGEFRYVTGRSLGRFDGSWLPDDDIAGPRSRLTPAFEDTTTLSSQWYSAPPQQRQRPKPTSAISSDASNASSISCSRATSASTPRPLLGRPA